MKRMSINDCKKLLNKNKKDDERIITTVKNALNRLKTIKYIPLTKETSTTIGTNYYDVIKELLIALANKNEIKSNNHECLIKWFEEKYKEYNNSKIIFELKDKRNRANYEGKTISKIYIKNNENELKNIIKEIIKKLK